MAKLLVYPFRFGFCQSCDSLFQSSVTFLPPPYRLRVFAVTPDTFLLGTISSTTISHVVFRIDMDSYIDTETGVDGPTANGSQARPFKSLSYAFIQNIDKPIDHYFVHASATGPAHSS